MRSNVCQYYQSTSWYPGHSNNSPSQSRSYLHIQMNNFRFGWNRHHNLVQVVLGSGCYKVDCEIWIWILPYIRSKETMLTILFLIHLQQNILITMCYLEACCRGMAYGACSLLGHNNMIHHTPSWSSLEAQLIGLTLSCCSVLCHYQNILLSDVNCTNTTTTTTSNDTCSICKYDAFIFYLFIKCRWYKEWRI